MSADGAGMPADGVEETLVRALRAQARTCDEAAQRTFAARRMAMQTLADAAASDAAADAAEGGRRGRPVAVLFDNLCVLAMDNV